MKILTYLAIFIAKIIENALSTLRLIVVAKGKKLFGAILQFVIAFVWVITTGIVVVNVKDDPLKVVFFAFGSLIGSYLGSLIEEKIALGSDLIKVIIDKNNYQRINKELSKKYLVTSTIGEKQNKHVYILFIIAKKKERNNIISLIQKLDEKAIITIEAIKNVSYDESLTSK
ncbi:MAG: DUF2179 domain-containing protein [Bacilli bacterium]|nr:DUF2179 domain-containing protein [Bacilli bacterium]